MLKPLTCWCDTNDKNGSMYLSIFMLDSPHGFFIKNISMSKKCQLHLLFYLPWQVVICCMFFYCVPPDLPMHQLLVHLVGPENWC